MGFEKPYISLFVELAAAALETVDDDLIVEEDLIVDEGLEVEANDDVTAAARALDELVVAARTLEALAAGAGAAAARPSDNAHTSALRNLELMDSE